MNTLWQEKEFEQICSKESLTEKAAEIQKKISVKEHERNYMISTRQRFMKIVFGKSFLDFEARFHGASD